TSMTLRNGCVTLPAENLASADSMASITSRIGSTMRTSCSESNTGIAPTSLSRTPWSMGRGYSRPRPQRVTGGVVKGDAHPPPKPGADDRLDECHGKNRDGQQDRHERFGTTGKIEVPHGVPSFH